MPGMSNKKRKTSTRKKTKRKAAPEPDPPPPAVCTFACPHGDFPEAYTAGACRTMSAVYCKLLEKNVSKNLPCTWRREQG